MTQRILSTILLLPQPLGPTIPVMLSSKFTMVLSAKLLKPFISKDFNRTVFRIFREGKYNGCPRQLTGFNKPCAKGFPLFINSRLRKISLASELLQVKRKK